jgi:ABC-2 type transport system ATP-binding protein
MEPLLAARGLAKRFGAVAALAGVDLVLGRGEVVGFLGPNGAGKSTTMKIVTGALAADAGTVAIAGHDQARDPLACRAAIGYLPESPPLYDDMRTEDFLDHVARLKGIAPDRRRRAVADAIARARLEEAARRRLGHLSKGNRQRAGLAQALLGAPPLLILDEPTSGLDPGQVASFRALVRELAADHTVLLSTHILAEVEAVCSRVVVIHRGRTVADEPIDALRRRTAAARLRVRVRSGDAAALATALTATAWATVERTDGDTVLCRTADAQRAALATLAEAHGGLAELVEERRPLEDVFAEMTAN